MTHQQPSQGRRPFWQTFPGILAMLAVIVIAVVISLAVKKTSSSPNGTTKPSSPSSASPSNQTSVTVSPTPSDMSSPAVSVTLTMPATGEVGSQTEVSGTVSDLPQGDFLWFAVEDPGSLKNNPDTSACTITGATFQCPTSLIGASNQVGKSFEAQIWLVNSQMVGEIEQYNETAAAQHYAGINLPAGAMVEAQNLVTRQ